MSMMESFLTPEFWLAVGQIVMIDVLLGGDNAVVIALACRNLPPELRRRGILWGTAGAIVLRVVLIFFAMSLLALPYLKLVGAALLLWIGVKLLVPEDELLIDAYRLRWQGALITLATLLLCLPLGWVISRILVKPLHALVKEAEELEKLLADPGLQKKRLKKDLKALRALYSETTVLGRRRTDLQEAAPAREIPLEAMIEREPVTVIMSRRGWIKAMKGHADLSARADFKFK